VQAGAPSLPATCCPEDRRARIQREPTRARRNCCLQSRHLTEVRSHKSHLRPYFHRDRKARVADRSAQADLVSGEEIGIEIAGAVRLLKCAS